MPSVGAVLVVCPLAVVAHWRRTIEATGDGGRDVVLINYERLGKLFELTPEARKRVRTKKGLARAGSAPEYDVVVWDESHRCKNPTARERYRQAWTEFRAEMDLRPGGANPRSALTATLRLRQKSSLIRVQGSAELVRELLENGHQVAVSVAFRETLEALRSELARDEIESATLHGGLPAGEREAERLRFQRGAVRVVLFTVEEGISLHQGEHDDAPRSEVIHDATMRAVIASTPLPAGGHARRDARSAWRLGWAGSETPCAASVIGPSPTARTGSATRTCARRSPSAVWRACAQ